MQVSGPHGASRGAVGSPPEVAAPGSRVVSQFLALWLRQQLGPCLFFEPVWIRGLDFRGFELCLGTRGHPPSPCRHCREPWAVVTTASHTHRFGIPPGAAEQTPCWPVACFLGDLSASVPSALCCVAPSFRVPGFIFLDTGPPLGIWILLCG